MTAKIGRDNSSHDDLRGCRMILAFLAATPVTPEMTETFQGLVVTVRHGR